MTAVVKLLRRKLEIDVYNAVKGYATANGVRYGNVLTRNMLYYIYGWLSDTGVLMVSLAGTLVAVDTWGDANRERCRLRWGTGTATPSLLDYKLASETRTTISIPNLIRSNNKYLVQWQASFTTSVREIGVSQYVYGAGDWNTVLLTRALVSVEPDQVLYYSIEVNAPFNRNFATLLCYYLRDEDSDMIRVDGVTFRARTGGDVNAGPASIFVSESLHSGDVDDLSIPSYTSVVSTHGVSVGDRGGTVVISGEFKPDRDFAIRSVGIVQPIFDTGGVGRPTLLAVMPLPSPVVVRAGERRTILFRLWHMA